ncbi:MAG: type II toxin-antitoxin system RelE/ParE family toxin [Proteobacteria bacterium]|nr:type II toxin-antitoxin system RelE/ParE family toxin [Pseudomonadota bacterium]
MSERWSVHFVNKIAKEEIFELSKDLRAKFLHIADLLVEFGPYNVGMPHIRPIADKIWELRLKGKDNIARSLYFLASKRKIIILHTFIKKTEKTSQKAIKLAKQRLKEIYDD